MGCRMRFLEHHHRKEDEGQRPHDWHRQHTQEGEMLNAWRGRARVLVNSIWKLQPANYFLESWGLALTAKKCDMKIAVKSHQTWAIWGEATSKLQNSTPWTGRRKDGQKIQFDKPSRSALVDSSLTLRCLVKPRSSKVGGWGKNEFAPRKACGPHQFEHW